jgi:O-antigen biosynthesis protein
VSRPAIVSLLWPRNAGVLETFATGNPGTVVLADHGFPASDLATRVAATGGELREFARLLSPEGRVRACRESKSLITDLETLLAGDEWSGFASDRGWSGTHLGAVIARRAQADMPEIVMTLAALESAFSTHSVRLVVTNEDFTPMRRAVVLWARARGIPSLHLEHALTLTEPYAVHGRIMSDILAVFAESGIEAYVEGPDDVPVDRIRVTGNPAWDAYASLVPAREAIRLELATRHECPASPPWIVFATTWGANWPARVETDVHARTLRWFLQTCRTLFDAGRSETVIVKDRPANQAFGRDLFTRLVMEVGIDPSRILYVTDEIEKWVTAADVVVSVNSLVSVEAILAATPAVNLLTEMDMTMGPMYDAGSGVVDAEVHELTAVLSRVIDDPVFRDEQRRRMRQAAPRYNLGFDGSATARVVRLMNELALPVGVPPRPPATAGLY